jgi:hypothetical protein
MQEARQPRRPHEQLAQFRPLAIQVDCARPIVKAKILEREFALPILKRAVAAKTKQRKFIVRWWRFDAHNQVLISAIRAAKFYRRFGHGARS